jgi:tape measure domain-containing protein
MAKVLGFTIEIQGQQKVIDTTNQLKEALKQIKDELGKTVDAKDYEKLAKEAAKLTTELNNVNKQQQEFNKEAANTKNDKGSYVELNAELVKLRRSYREMSEEERNGVAGRDALTRIGQLDRQLKGIDASMGNFQRNVGNYQRTLLGAIGELSPTFGTVTQSIGAIGKQASISGGLIASGLASVAVVGAIRAMSLAFTEAARAQEQMAVSFNTLTGSLSSGTAIMEQIKSLAANTPFELPQLQEGAKRLLAFGIESQDITEKLRQLGDISAGVGTEKLPNLILAFGQVKAAGKLTGNELRQFTEAGVNLLDQLAKQGGKSMSQVKQDIEDKKVSFQDVSKALEMMTSEGGRFFNMMENQSKTTAGQISNLKDSWNILSADLGKFFLPIAKSTIGGLNAMIADAKSFFGITNQVTNEINKQQNSFITLIEILKSETATTNEKNKAIATLNQNYPELIKNVDLHKASENELNTILRNGNIAFETRLKLSRTKAEYDKTANLAQQQYDEIIRMREKRNELIAIKERNIAEGTNERQKRIDNERINNITKSIEFAELKLSTFESKAKYLELESKNIEQFGAIPKAKTQTSIVSGIKDSGTAKKKGKTIEQLAKEANEAIKKSEDEFQKEMLALTKQIEDARIQIVQESYDRELAAIEKLMQDKIDAYNKERDDRLKINSETEAKIIAAFGANSKQLANFRKQTAEEQTAFIQRRQELDLLLFEEQNRLIAELDKKYAEKAKSDREKAFNERLQQTNKYFDNENKLSEAKSNETIAILQNASNDEQDAVEDNEKAKIKIRRKYDNLIREEQLKQLETELAAEEARKFAIEKAYESSGVNLQGGAPTQDAVSAIAEIQKKISALRKKGVKDNEKINKDEASADKKAMDEKTKRAIDAMNVIKDFASTVGDFIDELNKRQIARMEEQITAHQDKLSQLQEEMSNTTGAQRVELQRQIDNEKAALAASTQQKAEAEKQAAKEHQRIALIQAIIDTAAAIIANLKNPFQAIAAGVIGAVQIGTIASQAFADGGRVLSGEKIRNKPNIRMRNGDNVLATVRAGEVILNERQQARLGGAATFRRIGVPGFADGGFTGAPLPRPADYFMENATAGIPTNNEFKALIRSIDNRFDRLQVHVVGEDVANELNDQARAKKAAVI